MIYTLNSFPVSVTYFSDILKSLDWTINDTNSRMRPSMEIPSFWSIYHKNNDSFNVLRYKDFYSDCQYI